MRAKHWLGWIISAALCLIGAGPSTVLFPNNTPYEVVVNGGGAYSSSTVIVDGTAAANFATVKAASTAPVATDPALVVAISPNTPTFPVTATISGTPANNITQFGGNNIATGTGAGGNGIPRVTISNDSSLAANQSVNTAQFGGNNVVTGTGASGSGIPRVTVSNDSIVGAQITPSSAAGIGITPVVSSAVESNHVLKASAGNLYSVYVTTGGTAGYIMVFNATSAPADGAVTPIECVPISANQTSSINYNPGPPAVFSTGITAVFSTTGCFTKTASATAFFHGLVQ